MGMSKTPLLVIVSAIMIGVVYHFFNPWYIRLWQKAKRKYNRLVGGKG